MTRRTDLIDQFADLVIGADDPRRLAERTIDVVLSLVDGRCGAVFTLDDDRLLLFASRGVDQHALDAAQTVWSTRTDALRRGEAYGQYFKEAVRRELVERFGHARVYEGGLVVYTTVDLAMQKAAEAEVQRALKEIEERQAARRRKGAPAPTAPLQAALVALDPQTGEVRALVGGRDFAASPAQLVRAQILDGPPPQRVDTADKRGAAGWWVRPARSLQFLDCLFFVDSV